MEHVADALLVVAEERIDLRHALDVDAGGADQRQRGEPPRVARRKLGRDPAAEREADQIDAVEIELIEEIEIEVGEVGDVVEPVRRVGARRSPDARARSRHGARRGPPCTGSQLSGAAGAMQDQQRPARAAAHQADVAAADGDLGREGGSIPLTQAETLRHGRSASDSRQSAACLGGTAKMVAAFTQSQR